jgi:hypothetical protein
VRIQRERVRPLQAGEQRTGFRIAGSERAVGVVEVEPEALLGGDGGELVERIHYAGGHRARAAHQAERLKAGAAVLRDGRAELGHVAPLGVVTATDRTPTPRTPAAFATEKWASSEAYTLSRLRSVSGSVPARSAIRAR